MLSFPLSLPTTKSLASIRLIQRTQSAFYRSPFNGAMQVQSNQGEWWEAQVQFPPMKRYQAEDYLATLMGLRGPQGAIYLGDTNAKTPQGNLVGSTILVNGANQTGRILLVDGCQASTTVLKRGDYIQLGAGLSATRITTSGGGATTKALYDAGVSSNGVTYLHQVRIWNCGSKSVSVIGSGTSQTVTPGTQTSISISHVGDGVAHAQLWFDAPTIGDSIDFVVWDPVIRRYGVYENLIALASRRFVGWGYSGATLTLTQKINQRLHKVMEDVTSDSSGNAEIPLFPTLRHSPFDNEPVISSNCKGVFRLANQFDFNIDSDLAYGFSAQLVEAL